MLVYSLWFALMWILFFTSILIYSIRGSDDDWEVSPNYWVLLVNIPALAVLIEIISLGGINVK